MNPSAVSFTRVLGWLAAAILVVSGCTRVAPPSPGEGTAVASREEDLSHLFAGSDTTDATFVLLNAETGVVTRYNPDRARQRFIPASTYKIPNTLIALETGVAIGPDFTLRWDSTVRPDSGFWAPVWSQDHSLRTAIQNSVYWYYQELARRIGADRMQRYLNQFDYGNQNMRGGLDRFWLHGDLRISPDEQVAFLRRMYFEELGVSERSTEILKDILVLEEGPRYRLSGKTGTADVTPTRELAWLIGYVERDENVWCFALNMEGEEVWERWGAPAERLELVRTILQHLAVLPGQASDEG